MPTETYLNLSPIKRQRIFEAAVHEFAAQRFTDASINQIIKAAGISRGSFYQYFADKEDLYLYMLTEIGKEKLTLASQVEALHPEADFFEAYDHLMRTVLIWARERPLYHQIGQLMELDSSTFMTKLLERSAAGMAHMVAMIDKDKERGLIKSTVDADLLIKMILTLGKELMKEHYETDSSDEVLIEKMQRIMQILKEGVTHVHG